MKITKRTANALRKKMMLREFTYSNIAIQCGVCREAVGQWVSNQRIPDKYIAIVKRITGIKIK